MITITLVDDHQLVRQGLRALLDASDDLRVLAEAVDGRSALLALERARPDVLLLDLMMPGLSGIDVARQVSAAWPSVGIIIISMHASVPYVAAALDQGARGYVLKQDHSAELIQAIRDVAAGGRHISSAIPLGAIDAYRAEMHGTLDVLQTLTEREREIFSLVVNGLSSAAIAQQLTIGVRTVETHRANLLHKLGLRDRADLVRFAAQRNLISAP